MNHFEQKNTDRNSDIEQNEPSSLSHVEHSITKHSTDIVQNDIAHSELNHATGHEHSSLNDASNRPRGLKGFDMWANFQQDIKRQKGQKEGTKGREKEKGDCSTKGNSIQQHL